MENNKLVEFNQKLMSEVEASISNLNSDWIIEDHFTLVMSEYLEDIGEVEQITLCSYREKGVQLNAFEIDEENESVSLFVSQYFSSVELKVVQKSDVDALVKRAINIYRLSINNLKSSLANDSDMFEFAQRIYDNQTSIKTVKIVVLTNGIIRNFELDDIELGEVLLKVTVWDIDKLFKCVNSGKMREIIEVDFIKEFGFCIECIENVKSEKYKVYLAIISGEALAKIYGYYGSRILERNVRSFLQIKGQINKGIRSTIETEPDMFLAYNNGIAVTAEKVEILRDSNGKPTISKIRDMQIVNGGQTTASIYSASIEKKSPIDISKIYVQMKISEINCDDDMEVIVPKISTYSNTQNKVQTADFSANDPFHRKIEEFSRTVWTPNIGTRKPIQWFYERARGQYSDQLLKAGTPARRKIFKDENPIFTKTDLAKFENTWDQLPYYVSEGAQKNFKRFTIRLADRGKFIPDQKYYELLIAKAILFRETEKIISRQNFGGYRANIVTYTISFISNATSQRINLNEIWRNQQLSESLASVIKDVSHKVRDVIINPPGGKNIGEWCKNIKCWEKVKELNYAIPKEVEDELLNISKTAIELNSGISCLTQDEKNMISEAQLIDSNIWFKLSKWAKETNNFEIWQRKLAFTMGSIKNRNIPPSIKQAKHSLAIYNDALKLGFDTEA